MKRPRDLADQIRSLREGRKAYDKGVSAGRAESTGRAHPADDRDLAFGIAVFRT